ncbi:MAG: ribbon-helix-helix protein, CopG family [Tepidiformaceae bacterium]
MRTIIDLPEDQLSALAEVCRIGGISRAEAIRRAVDLYLKDAERLAEEQAEKARAFKAAFGSWKHRGVDTDTYLAEIRAEWDTEDRE